MVCPITSSRPSPPFCRRKANFHCPGRAVEVVHVQDDPIRLERLLPVLHHLKLHRVQALHTHTIEAKLVPDDLGALVDHVLPVHVNGGHGHLLHDPEVLLAQLAEAGLLVGATAGQHLLGQVHRLLVVTHIVLLPAAQQNLGTCYQLGPIYTT